MTPTIPTTPMHEHSAVARAHRPAALALAAALALPLMAATPEPAALAQPPARWQAALPEGAGALPHDGQLADLQRWWQQFDDPALAGLVDAAQAASPDTASALSRISQARASRVAAGAALLPLLDAGAQGQRARTAFDTPPISNLSAKLDASWEIDLFGGGRAARDAALARLAGAQADWHLARVSVAAEVANSLLTLRACERLEVQARDEARSRGETARLLARSLEAGFESPANAALARASAAQASLSARTRAVQCQQEIKALVALTALDEAPLRERLAPRTAQLPQPAALVVAAVPAQALAQRPDLFARARALEAAAADVTESRAQQLPRVSLSGSLGASSLWASGFQTNGSVWSIGPLQVTLPLFDGGTRSANTDAARARYDEALAAYQGRLRQAVREVEDALVRLQDGAARRDDAQRAVDGYALSVSATELRQRAGLASVLDLEDNRRSLMAARSQQVETEREQVAAWIALYRALGGGWSATQPSPDGVPPAGDVARPIAQR
jgi:multidrug efflux system outer membrane protein